jgi:hypothetical protein
LTPTRPAGAARPRTARRSRARTSRTSFSC